MTLETYGMKFAWIAGAALLSASVPGFAVQSTAPHVFPFSRMFDSVCRFAFGKNVWLEAGRI